MVGFDKVSIRDVNFGKNVKVVEPVNMYECTIGDNCFIGPFVEIQKGVFVGNNTKIQSHSMICELVKIGNNCFIGHGVIFINDLFKSGNPAGGDKNLWHSTIIGDNVNIGSNVTLLPINICSNVVIGAGSVVTKLISSRNLCRKSIVNERIMINCSKEIKVPFVDLHAQYIELKDEIDNVIKEVIKNSSFIRRICSKI